LVRNSSLLHSVSTASTTLLLPLAMTNGYSETDRRLSMNKNLAPSQNRTYEIVSTSSSSRSNARRYEETLLQLKRFTVSLRASQPSFCERKPRKIAGGVYSEGWPSST